MSKQEGERPAHYDKGDAPQHWDRMWELYREAWFVGNVTKYVERYRGKDGLKDLRKARTYLDKLIELEEKEVARDQAVKAGVLPFNGPHPDGAVARAARINKIEDQL